MNKYIKTIKTKKMSRKQAIYLLANSYSRAQNERRIAQCDLSNSPILTDEEIANLEDLVSFYTDQILEVRKAAKELDLPLDVKGIHWKEDDYIPMF
jgi:hypothetical protein